MCGGVLPFFLSLRSQASRVPLVSHCFHFLILIQLMSHYFVLKPDVTSRTHNSSTRSSGQDVGSTVGYLCTTTSSGANLCQNAEEKRSSSDLRTSALPPEGQDLLRSSVELHHTNKEQDIVQSPVPPVLPADLPGCDITCTASSEVGGAKTTIQTASGKTFAGCGGATFRRVCVNKSRVVAADFGTSDLTLLQCRQLADELKQVARRAVGLHQQVNSLSEAPDSLCF